jgi:hypothetical protein
VFENRALRRIFGPKRDEMTEDWRKLDNDIVSNELRTIVDPTNCRPYTASRSHTGAWY